LTPLSNVLLSNWVSGAQGKPDLRVWCSMDPAVSRAQALRLEESCYDFCLVCLGPMEHNHYDALPVVYVIFFRAWRLVMFYLFSHLPRMATLFGTLRSLRCGVTWRLMWVNH
jgi:hypothetical protein